MKASEKAAKIEKEIRELSSEQERIIHEIDSIEAQIKSIIVKDESTARKMIADKGKAEEKIAFIRYKIEALKGELDSLRGDVIREKIADTRADFTAREKRFQDARAKKEKLEAELKRLVEDVNLQQIQLSNVSGIIGDLEFQLRQYGG